ncbi:MULTISPECIES: hypothetical protein [Calothrix]|uniref:Uncharacterized protein n=2 Tax=Calothrix TaxID=1186 RepID=A0ABR8AMS7_9CYAN|nr:MULTISPECIES: hypothetical protein [Calothrix]MBD2200530.1 hypothetical protein [Calothrix parietina FACHB-288]MBD2229578.1 hypothetical protein [Calothrix anomala FACHB-343]
MKLSNKYLALRSRLSLSVLILDVIIVILPEQSISNSRSPNTEIPTVTWQNTRLPDWDQITFATMPAISESASFQAPPGVTDKLGYDPSRSWNVGEKPDSFTMLGDFQDSFQLQKFSLTDIYQNLNQNLQKVNLGSFGVMKFQTLYSLVKAIPNLKDFPLNEVKPIFDLLSQKLSSSFDAKQTIGNLLQQSPHLGKLSLSSLNLKSYNLNSIPGLSTTPIGSFEKWQGVYIDEIPGLADVPFSQFPNPINPVGTEVGIVDIAFATNEQKRNRTISGSDKEGFAVPCDRDCSHTELSGSPVVNGKAWVSGKYQLVKGGKGILGSVNDGKEPTGRQPFGDAFKVAIWDVSEVDGMITQALFFRVCMRNNFVDLGCTPYFIGPVPFMSYKEKEPIFLGAIDESKNSVSTPTGLKSSGFTFNKSPITSRNALSNLIPAAKGDCKKLHSSGINIDALSNAMLSTEENYNAVGSYVCDSNGNCGRALGAMQLMSYRSDVRKIISSKSGGSQFLTKLDTGKEVTGEEMMQYFSPTEQQSLIEIETNNLLSTASQQIDPSTVKPFSGDRLIERAAQMHFTGVGIPADELISDVREENSVKEYGSNVAHKYSKAMESMGCLK